jgi:hypothetical protein
MNPTETIYAELFKYYDESKFPAVKKVTLALREKKIVYKDSVHI